MTSPREAELLAQLQSRDERIACLEQENALLRQKIDLMVRKLFGAQSEKLDPAQLLLLLQGFDEPGKAPEPVAAEVPRRSPDPSPPRARRPRLPEHLPVIEEVIVPEPVKLAPHDWRRIGEPFRQAQGPEPAEGEVGERLDYEPARFLRRRTVRPKYVQRGLLDAIPIVAPLPDSLLERSLVAPGLLAQIVVSKYCDHLPLYRQESIYWTRHQVWLPRQTLAEWVELAADWLQPIYEHLRRDVLSGGYVQVDETPIRYLSPGHGKTKLGYLWTCGVPRGDAIFHWETSRAATCLENLIPVDFSGTLQCDSYEAYACFARRRGSQIVLAGCLAHVRRKFYEAREQAPKVAGWFLRSSLLIFLEDGRLEIDNNLIENAIRPTAIGKKNWLFIGQAQAGARSAIIYTVIESCRRRGLDPFAYLRDVFTRLPSMTNWQVKDLTPEAWAKSQKRVDRRAA